MASRINGVERSYISAAAGRKATVTGGASSPVVVRDVPSFGPFLFSLAVVLSMTFFQKDRHTQTYRTKGSAPPLVCYSMQRQHSGAVKPSLQSCGKHGDSRSSIEISDATQIQGVPALPSAVGLFQLVCTVASRYFNCIRFAFQPLVRLKRCREIRPWCSRRPLSGLEVCPMLAFSYDHGPPPNRSIFELQSVICVREMDLVVGTPNIEHKNHNVPLLSEVPESRRYPFQCSSDVQRTFSNTSYSICSVLPHVQCIPPNTHLAPRERSKNAWDGRQQAEFTSGVPHIGAFGIPVHYCRYTWCKRTYLYMSANRLHPIFFLSISTSPTAHI